MENLQTFLQYFWNPLFQMLKDIKDVKWVDIWKCISLEDALEINSSSPFSVNFTPNWNFWSVNTIWKPTTRKASDVGTVWIINALFIDIDLKGLHWETMESLYSLITKTIYTYKVTPTFIVQSWGGYHLYWIIDQSIRAGLTLETVRPITEYFQRIFPWADKSCKFTVDRLMRLPTSNHRKTWEPILVDVIQYNEDAIINKEAIDKALMFLAREEEMGRVEAKARTLHWLVEFDKCKDIPMPKVFEALPTRKYMWFNYSFCLEWEEIAAIINWVKVKTDWYKYNKVWNFVNCFSFSEHPLEERPRWWPYSFVYYYFDKSAFDTNKFFTEKFWIRFLAKDEKWDEYVVQEFEKDDYKIEITNKKTTMSYQISLASGKKRTTCKELFKVPIEVIWKWKTKYKFDFSELDSDQFAYIFNICWKQTLVHRIPTKKKFNEYYSSTLFYYWEDDHLWYLFEAIDKSTSVQEMEIIMKNWIYDWYTLLWWEKIVVKKDTNACIIPNLPFRLKIWDQVSVKEALDDFIKIYKPEIAVPAFLQTLALAGMNLRNLDTIYPWLLLTWMSWHWKTQMCHLLKWLIWYETKAREYSLPHITPQPLSQYATDYSILFLEELTKEVNPKTEETLRNIINRNKGWRWIANWNLFYNFCSWLFVTWERTFKDFSLNNRFVILTIDKQFWQPNWKDHFNKVASSVCTEEVYWIYYKVKDTINKTYKDINKELSSETDNKRAIDVRSFIFVVNRIFDLWISQKDLKSYMNINLKRTWLLWNNDTNESMELLSILNRWVFRREFIYMITDFWWNVQHSFQPADDSAFQKSISTLNFLSLKINEKCWSDVMSVNNYWILFNIKASSPEIDVIVKILDTVHRANYKNVYTSTQSF